MAPTIQNNSYFCPITYEPILDEVITKCGHRFERSAIIEWVEKSGTCPLDRSIIHITDLKKEDEKTNTIALESLKPSTEAREFQDEIIKLEKLIDNLVQGVEFLKVKIRQRGIYPVSDPELLEDFLGRYDRLAKNTRILLNQEELLHSPDMKAQWCRIRQKMHENLPRELERMHYTLTGGSTFGFLRDPFPLMNRRGLIWFPTLKVVSPFELEYID